MPLFIFCFADEPIIGREERLVSADCDHISPRVGTRNFHCRRGRIGPVLAELYHFRAFEQLEHSLGGIELDLGWPGKVGAHHHLTMGGLHHWFIRMAKRNGAQTHSVFNELVSIYVPNMTAFTSNNEGRRAFGILIVSFGVGMATARYQIMAFQLKYFRI